MRRQSSGEDAIAELEGSGNLGLLDIAPGQRDPEGRANLIGAPGGDPPRMSTVLPRPPPTLREVERARTGGPTNLLRKIAVPVPNQLHRTPERPHEIETDFESFEHLP